MLHFFCQLKMLCQRHQLIICDPCKVSAGKLCKVDLAVGRCRKAISFAGHAQKLQIKGNIMSHQWVFANKQQKAIQRFPWFCSLLQFRSAESCQGCDLCRNVFFHADQHGQLLHRYTVPDPQRSIFDDGIGRGFQAGGFQIDHGVIACARLCSARFPHHLLLCRFAEPGFQVDLVLFGLRQRSSHQFDPVKVHGFPCGIVGAKIHPLLSRRGEHQCCLSVFQVLTHPLPQGIPHAAAHIAHINARVDLAQPFGQIPAQFWRAVRHGENYDVSSPSSSK